MIKTEVPEGAAGNWVIRRIFINEEQAAAFNAAAGKARNACLVSGWYTSLWRKGSDSPIMSDVPAEIADLKQWQDHATGKCLISGLGLGIATELALAKPDVTKVTVLEASEDVISLVAPHLTFKYENLEIIHANVFDWIIPDNAAWDAIWHDIWDTIDKSNIDEFEKLGAKFRNYAKWQGFWGLGEDNQILEY